jgi:hypothetical protein
MPPKIEGLMMSNVTLSKAAEHQEQISKPPRTAAQQPKVKYKVKYIASPADIPAGQNHVLVEYGAESGQKRHALGFTSRLLETSQRAISPF